MSRENIISSAILVRKKDVSNYISTQNLSPKEDIQQIYQEFADNLREIDINKVEYILQNRSFKNNIDIGQLQQDIGSYLNESLDYFQSEKEIISLLSFWLPDVNFVRILPGNNKGSKEQRIMIECNTLCKESKIKFYMKLTLTEKENLGHILQNQEKDIFNEISSYSARFLSMKYQKVLSEHILMSTCQGGIINSNLTGSTINTSTGGIISNSAQGMAIKQDRHISIKRDEKQRDQYFIDIVLSDYCEYSLREILYPIITPKQQPQKSENNISYQELKTNSSFLRGKTERNDTNGDYANRDKGSMDLIEKFSFQHLQKDIVEGVFFMHTRGYTHNQINIDTIFYDKYINAFVIGSFDRIQKRVHNYDAFKPDINSIGFVLISFLAALYKIPLQHDLHTLDDNAIINVIIKMHANKLIHAKKNFILLNLNLYQQRNILLDIFCPNEANQILSKPHSQILSKSPSQILQKSPSQMLSKSPSQVLSKSPSQIVRENSGSTSPTMQIKHEKQFDIVELAIALNIQHCLVESSHSTIKGFLSQNEVFDENSLSSHLIDPLNNKFAYWKYKGSTKNGLFNGLGEIVFEPPLEQDEIRQPFNADYDYEDNIGGKDSNNQDQINDSIITPPAVFNAFPSMNNQSTTKLIPSNKNYNQQSPIEMQNINNNGQPYSNRLNNKSNGLSYLDGYQTDLNNNNKAKESLFNISPLTGMATRELSMFVPTVQQTKATESIQIFKGVWESGFNQKYLTFVTIDQFKELFMLNNYMKIIAHNNHQELQFSVQSDRKCANKTIDVLFSTEKEQIIDSLNILIKYLQIPVARITFDLKGALQRKMTNEAQSIELQSDDGSVICILFDCNYVIKEEEFYIILEKATLSTYLILEMTDTQISDKFFYGMSFNPKLQYLSHLQLSHSSQISDEGFIYFVRNCPSQHLVSLDISHTQLTDISIMELTVSNRITKLTHLNISNNPSISEKVIIEYIKSSNSFFISHLNVSALDISDNFIEILCLSPFMKNISEIIMNNCPKITFQIFEIFTKSESVNCIKRIELSYCLKHSTTTAAKKTGLLDKRKSKQEFKQFAKTNKLGNLQVINLEGCQILHNHIKQLANSHSMKLLEEINISNCEHVNDECIKEISTSQNFLKLRNLILSNLKNLTPASIEFIGNSKYLTNLDLIYLDGCDKLDKNTLVVALNFVNFQNLKILKFDENQYSIQTLRQINFSNKNSVQTFWRILSIEIVITNPDLFFKVYFSEILSFNQKPIKFVVSKLQESLVIQKLAAILNHQIYNLHETNCRINVNNIVLNDRILEEVKKQKQALKMQSCSNADVFSNFKQFQRIFQFESFKKENTSLDQSFAILDSNEYKNYCGLKNLAQQPPSFQQLKIYCKNECFKAMHYIKFVKNLRKLDLSFSKAINLPGYQFIKECIFFPHLIELNLQNLPILDKHIQQMCFGIEFSSLRILNLKNCYQITFQGLNYFIKAGIDKTLQYLDVCNSSIEGTHFTLCLPDFIYLSQLNSGIINIILQADIIVKIFIQKLSQKVMFLQNYFF